MNKTYSGIAVLALIIVAIAVALVRIQDARFSDVNRITTVSYACLNGRAIVAQYYRGEPQPSVQPDMPPIPGGSVVLGFSDGRSVSLPETISASGVRYANADESLIFWNKGNGVFVLENGQEKTYIGCIEVPKDPGGLAQVFADGARGFSIRFPDGYVIDDSYRYDAFGPNREIDGVKFTIASVIAEGTNLSKDSYVSVEQIPDVRDCTAARFLDDPQLTPISITDNGTEYSVASSTGAAVGNRYEETVYALTGTYPCMAVRYVVHYGVFENYPLGSVRRFDNASLMSQFDLIRRTLTISQ